MIGNLNTIRSEGYRALTRELGAAGAAQFLRQMENGRGNYTDDRRPMLDENSVDDIVKRIQERKAESK